MKRRNAECGKIRRPVKRTKIAEGIYGSTFLYVKFLFVWALVLLADFLLEFRFEYLWPFWLLLRSVYDSFKYQGLAFSVFFVFIAFTSDMICFLFIPVHWLFFAASTYVWVQYVWHTERGICLPTISLWLLFVYIEASVRLKELKNLPFHLDLCRPFAAHCIGYPVVTLGFGFKSYVGYRMRLRKQKEVAKENEFYIHLLQQALPAEAPSLANASQDKEKASKSAEEVISNGHCVAANHGHGRKSICSGNSVSSASTNHHHHHHHNNNNNNNSLTALPALNGTGPAAAPYSELEQPLQSSSRKGAADGGGGKQDYQCSESKQHAANDFDESDESVERQPSSSLKSNGVACHAATGSSRGGKSWGSSAKDNLASNHVGGKKGRQNNASSSARDSAAAASAFSAQKDEHTYRLEADIKRLKADLQSSRQCEQELRSQIHSISAGERSVKSELLQLQQDNDSLQHKVQSLSSTRQQDKSTISSLEKRLQEERRMRTLCENQLAAERKAKKADGAAATRTECTESCKARRRDMENEIKQLRRDMKLRDDKIHQLERQTQETMGSTQALVSALSATEEKNARLENSLSAETRLKLDLFSALGEAKRQLEIAQTVLAQRDKEIDELKSKIAEVMAVMPVTSSPNCYSSPSQPTSISLSSILYSPKYLGAAAAAAAAAAAVAAEEKVKSNLDPNASVYTPKGANRLANSAADANDL